jgi:hypothetical protein
MGNCCMTSIDDPDDGVMHIINVKPLRAKPSLRDLRGGPWHTYSSDAGYYAARDEAAPV